MFSVPVGVHCTLYSQTDRRVLVGGAQCGQLQTGQQQGADGEPLQHPRQTETVRRPGALRRRRVDDQAQEEEQRRATHHPHPDLRPADAQTGQLDTYRTGVPPVSSPYRGIPRASPPYLARLQLNF